MLTYLDNKLFNTHTRVHNFDTILKIDHLSSWSHTLLSRASYILCVYMIKLYTKDSRSNNMYFVIYVETHELSLFFAHAFYV